MPAKWEDVDLESDFKLFSLVEGAAEESRLNQKSEAELIANEDYNSINLVDPLSKRQITKLK